MFKTFLKGTIAILAGIASGVVLSIGTDIIMESAGVYPSFADQMNGTQLTTLQLLLATLYRSFYTVVSGFVCYKLAPHHPMRYAKALGIIAVVANVMGLIILPDASQMWYPIALAVLAFPCCYWGGKIAQRRKS